MTERVGKQPLKLPPVGRSAYLKHPGEGMQMPKQRRLKHNQSSYGIKKQMCGLCGSMHVPGEAHHTMKASQFSMVRGMKGVKRIGGGFGYNASRNQNYDQSRKQSIAPSSNTRSIS